MSLSSGVDPQEGGQGDGSVPRGCLTIGLLPFRIDNTDHIIDVNKNNLPFEYDQVNIICPVYPHTNQGTAEGDDEEEERYIIYNVSKEEYDSCRITNPNPRIIAVCDNPNQVRYFTITFRSFTPQPGGLEFLPGHDYYFVSTSTGDPEGLYQRVGGRCATHNMKVIFKVCCTPTKGNAPGSSSNHQTSTVNVSVPVSAAPPTSSPRPPPDRNNLYPPSPSPKGMRPPAATRLPMRPYEVPIEDEMDRSPPSEKEKEETEKSPKRERAKNEELVNGAPLNHKWFIPHGAYYCACLLCYLLVSLLYR
ncbi:ephrin-B1 [Trichonephila inaurata madagascariensis]|uniref:Ephrin-B1 n=1 Tax=Trichonephila inaurata madagascariensis TaxID=2747483 RepID=A0A8X7BWF1_9ARAC|nr:ephrin-B1 [Trichonephila inaurata madagascariensis]